ncbi:MAG: mycothiol synthase [Actinophytocola sp.]|uniref:mycothiol synthase n=1 Tax=Actinophytocola sp. TaxID=1872138 RepID=UPI001320EDA9|nr:mycothiol synthase [Actinophytocola sp.]MPZ80554.1 mycothiol synthase [Actinophytocola sp.]
MRITWQESAPGDDVRALLRAARAHDGRPEVDEQGPLPREFRGGSHLLAHEGGELVGYAHLDTGGDAFGNQVAEAVVHPAHRCEGHGTRLVEAVLDRAEEKLRIWSHGDHPAAVRIAERKNLARVRELLKMRLTGLADLPAPSWPDGVGVRTFVPGRDEAELVAVNGRAFDWHPEQSRLTVEEVVATEREGWFDPKGLFLATRADKVVGFHWTKVHPGEIGEVYVVGVDPAAQGGGLGRALTLVGLHHLRDIGLGEAVLYVESDNSAAVALYNRLGFTVAETDVAYQR